MSRKTYNVEYINALLQTDKAFALMARRRSIASYEEFIEILYEDIDQIFAQMGRSAHVMQKDSEDRITSELVSNLRSRTYTAKHDAMAGGHVDVDVELNDYCWLGEAKFDNGAAYIEQGFLQLTTRYSSGNPSHDHGGLLIYIKQPNALQVMTKWRVALEGSAHAPDLSISECKNHPLAFHSKHTHKTTGLPFKVRHMSLLIHFDPQDKSGQNRKT